MAEQQQAWREGVTDEQIQEQINQISQDIQSNQPLVGEKEQVAVLLGEPCTRMSIPI